MCFFGKKASVKRAENNELIDANAKSIEALVVLAKDNEELIAKLREVQEKLKFLPCSEKGAVRECDKKIKNLIEDMRIELTKADGEECKRAEDILTQIKLMVADRAAKL